MKHSNTYDEIKEMRGLVAKELIAETQHLYDYPMTADHVAPATIEDRLRTYMQAGLTVVDLEGGDSRADEEARAKAAYAALATTPAVDRDKVKQDKPAPDADPGGQSCKARSSRS